MAINSDTARGILASFQQRGEAKETNRILRKLNSNLENDQFDTTKAMHKIERKQQNRVAELQAEADAKYIRGESKTKEGKNPFETNEVTKLYVESLKDVAGEVHQMTRTELEANITKMDALMQSIVDDESIEERDFLLEQYGKTLKFMGKEREKRANLMARSMNKMGELTEQYLDIQSLASGFFDNNPVAMGLFKIAGDSVRGYREKKRMQKSLVAEDLRRQEYARVLEEDKAKDQALAAKREEEIQNAKMDAANKLGISDEQYNQLIEEKRKREAEESDVEFEEETLKDMGIDSDEWREGLQEGMENGIAEAFAGGFEFPQDEYSDTGDAPLSADDMAGIFGVTGGTGAVFTRDHDAEAEAERLEAISMMNQNAEALQEALIPGPENRDAELESAVVARANEREDDERHAENIQYQEELFDKLDTMIGHLESMDKTFTKADKAGGLGIGGGGSGGGGDNGIMDEVLGGGIVAAAGKMLGKTKIGKVAGKVAGKAGGMALKFAKPAAKLAAGAAGAVGLGGLAGKGMGMFEKMEGSMAKKAAGEGLETAVEKGGAKAAQKAAAKSVGKGLGKSLLKKIPGIGLLAGAGFAIGRLMDGDFTGAGMELASGAASLLPGAGTAASVGIDAALIARDMSKAKQTENGADITKTEGLREQIALGEGTTDAQAQAHGFASGYDVPYGYGQYGMPEKPLSQMTIAEVKEFQKKQIGATRGTIPGTHMGTGAVGKYQVTQGTLADQQKKLGFKDDDLYNAELQEKIATSLMQKRGLDQYMAGNMSQQQIEKNLSKEWASVADPSTGRSAYGQATGTSTQQIRAALEQLPANERQDILQTVKLEQATAGYQHAKEKAGSASEMPVVMPPPKTHSLATQTPEPGRTRTGVQSARNSDSTLERVTDRFITHGMA